MRRCTSFDLYLPGVEALAMSGKSENELRCMLLAGECPSSLVEDLLATVQVMVAKVYWGVLAELW